MKFLDKQHSDIVCFTINVKGKLGKEYSYTKWHNLYFGSFFVNCVITYIMNKNAQHPIQE